VALLPGNDDHQGTWWSHRGLTYGGLIMDAKCRTAQVRDIFCQVQDVLKEAGFSRVVYKHIPWIYCRQPAEEDLFALLNVCRAALRSRDVASVVMLNDRLPLSTLRKRGVKRAQKADLQIAETTQFGPFWQLLEDNLARRYQAHPVHRLDEMALLHARFPENIRLFVVKNASELLGGSVLYIDRGVVKTQYISASEAGKRLGALDFLFDFLLNAFALEGKCFFDFGTSNLVTNDDLNDSLIFQKEGFGGRAVCYDSYEWML